MKTAKVHDRILEVVYWYIFVPIAKLYIKKVDGIKNLPKSGAFILAISHTDYLDGIFACAPLPFDLARNLRPLVYKSYFSMKGWGRIGTWIVRFFRSIPTGEGVKRVIEHYKDYPETILVMAPKVTRVSEPFVVGPGTGAVVLAAKLGIPIVPVKILYDKNIWLLGSARPQNIFVLKNVEVCYGESIDIKQSMSWLGHDMKKWADEVVKRIEEC